jgi:hypothetical protein
MACFWVGSINGVRVWAAWLFYSLLVDLTDRIADALDQPFEDISKKNIFNQLRIYFRYYQFFQPAFF